MAGLGSTPANQIEPASIDILHFQGPAVTSNQAHPVSVEFVIQPPTIRTDHVVASTVLADTKWITKRVWSADIDSVRAGHRKILFVVNGDHLKIPTGS